MNYLVTDLECTCTNKKEFPRHEMEIIEIGSILLDSNLNELSTFQSFVKPTINPILTEYCTNLTGITQDHVDNANTLDIVLDDFKRKMLCYNNLIFVSWGKFDYYKIKRESKNKNIEDPLNCDFLDYKREMARLSNIKKSGIGLKKALNKLNLTMDGPQHRALNDARAVVNIMQKLKSDKNV